VRNQPTFRAEWCPGASAVATGPARTEPNGSNEIGGSRQAAKIKCGAKRKRKGGGKIQRVCRRRQRKCAKPTANVWRAKRHVLGETTTTNETPGNGNATFACEKARVNRAGNEERWRPGSGASVCRKPTQGGTARRAEGQQPRFQVKATVNPARAAKRQTAQQVCSVTTCKRKT